MTNFITRGTFTLIQKEYEVIKKKVFEAGKVVGEALASGGGWHDNAVYDIAQNDQNILAEKQSQIELYLQKPVFIDDLSIATEKVSVGTHVHVCRSDNNKNSVYTILGAADAVFSEDKSIISYRSPMGQLLLEKKVGDCFSAPNGTYRLCITDINVWKP